MFGCYSKQEEYLAQEHAENIERLRAQNADETQQILTEFSKAQSILKDKIQDLSDLLVSLSLYHTTLK